MGLFALVAICFAILFYRAAEYERMTAWAWAIASLALTFVLFLLIPRIGIVILAQIGLFGVMWWYNARRHDKAKQQKSN